MTILENFRCRVSLAVNGIQAVEVFLDEKPNLILMDCQMPKMDGFRATDEIRRQEERLKIETHIPIIALTANALEGDKKKCLAAGMNDYLIKPFKPDELYIILERWSRPDQKMDINRDIESPQSSDLSDDEMDFVIDYSAIHMIKDLQREGEPSILMSVVQAYIEHVESSLSDLERKSSVSSVRDLQLFAHSLKSSSANVGAMELSRICKKIEMGCKDNTILDTGQSLELIQAEFTKVKSALQKEIN